jgi:hypothetical protein
MTRDWQGINFFLYYYSNVQSWFPRYWAIVLLTPLGGTSQFNKIEYNFLYNRSLQWRLPNDNTDEVQPIQNMIKLCRISSSSYHHRKNVLPVTLISINMS